MIIPEHPTATTSAVEVIQVLFLAGQQSIFQFAYEIRISYICVIREIRAGNFAKLALV